MWKESLKIMCLQEWILFFSAGFPCYFLVLFNDSIFNKIENMNFQVLGLL